MMDYCARETTINRDDLPMYSGEEVRNPRRESTIAVYANNTSDALKEANLALDRLFENLFGPRTKNEDKPPIPPVECFEQQMAQNAEFAMITANRVSELIVRMFG
jgi:hypothetical protein